MLLAMVVRTVQKQPREFLFLLSRDSICLSLSLSLSSFIPFSSLAHSFDDRICYSVIHRQQTMHTSISQAVRHAIRLGHHLPNSIQKPMDVIPSSPTIQSEGRIMFQQRLNQHHTLCDHSIFPVCSMDCKRG